MIDEPVYPLSWPGGTPRTPAEKRKHASFAKRADSVPGQAWRPLRELTVHQALRRLDEEVRAFTRYRQDWRINPERVVVSSNLRVRKDGTPMADQKEPADPGVAVYFELDGDRRCVPCDKWTRAADNIAGIAAALGALRGLERWVNDAHVRAAFQGFLALPDPNKVDWRAILGIKSAASMGRNPTREDVLARYRTLSFERHPDRGGSTGSMAELNVARDQALAELEASR